MARRARRSRIGDLRDIALAMPHVTEEIGSDDNPIYQVGGKTFVFFRNPRPDAVDEPTGERLTDVIAIWTRSLEDKDVLVQDPDLPFFTTAHFDGHEAVLVRASRIGEVPLDVLTEVVEEGWLARASPARARAWLAEHPPAD